MNKRHVAGNFELDISKNKAELFYQGKLFLNNCDDIVKLCLDLGIDEYSSIEKFDLEEEELEWLITMLNRYVLNSDLCLKK